MAEKIGGKDMTQAEKRMKQYVNAVERRLNLPRSVRARVMTDFTSAIQARREAGEGDEAILAELGSPKEAAAVLNEQMKEYAYRKSKWRFLPLAAAVLGLAGLGYLWVVQWLLGSIFGDLLYPNGSIGIIGGADGPTAIFVATATGVDWDAVLFALLAVAGVAGYWLLGHLKRK